MDGSQFVKPGDDQRHSLMEGDQHLVIWKVKRGADGITGHWWASIGPCSCRNGRPSLGAHHCVLPHTQPGKWRSTSCSVSTTCYKLHVKPENEARGATMQTSCQVHYSLFRGQCRHICTQSNLPLHFQSDSLHRQYTTLHSLCPQVPSAYWPHIEMEVHRFSEAQRNTVIIRIVCPEQLQVWVVKTVCTSHVCGCMLH